MKNKTEPDKIAVSHVILKIAGKEIRLTIAEAKELQEILDTTFPKKEIVYIPNNPIICGTYYPTWPHTHWSHPTWTSGYTTTENCYTSKATEPSVMCLSTARD